MIPVTLSVFSFRKRYLHCHDTYPVNNETAHFLFFSRGSLRGSLLRPQETPLAHQSARKSLPIHSQSACLSTASRSEALRGEMIHSCSVHGVKHRTPFCRVVDSLTTSGNCGTVSNPRDPILGPQAYPELPLQFLDLRHTQYSEFGVKEIVAASVLDTSLFHSLYCFAVPAPEDYSGRICASVRGPDP